MSLHPEHGTPRFGNLATHRGADAQKQRSKGHVEKNPKPKPNVEKSPGWELFSTCPVDLLRNSEKFPAGISFKILGMFLLWWECFYINLIDLDVGNP